MKYLRLNNLQMDGGIDLILLNDKSNSAKLFIFKSSLGNFDKLFLSKKINFKFIKFSIPKFNSKFYYLNIKYFKN